MLNPLLRNNTQIKLCTSYKHVFFLNIRHIMVNKNETYIHLEQPSHLPGKTWKYCGSAFGPDVSG